MRQDPNQYPLFPGLPAASSAHAPPLRRVLPGRLQPAISQAEHERHGRMSYGPPAGGWPVPPSIEQLGIPIQASGEFVVTTPLRQRIQQGLSDYAAKTPMPPVLQLGVGALLAAVPQLLATMTDEQVIASMQYIISMLNSWITDDGSTPDDAPRQDSSTTST